MEEFVIWGAKTFFYKLKTIEMSETSENILLPIELITPDLARQYLKRNSSCNKPLEEDKVNALVEKINNGKWDSNGDAIYFHHGDVLANGQHRMHAIVRSGISVSVRVFRMPAEE